MKKASQTKVCEAFSNMVPRIGASYQEFMRVCGVFGETLRFTPHLIRVPKAAQRRAEIVPGDPISRTASRSAHPSRRRPPRARPEQTGHRSGSRRSPHTSSSRCRSRTAGNHLKIGRPIGDVRSMLETPAVKLELGWFRALEHPISWPQTLRRDCLLDPAPCISASNSCWRRRRSLLCSHRGFGKHRSRPGVR